MISVPSLAPLLERVRRTGCFVPGGEFSSLLVRGKDAQDLIHRLSTNDLRQIPPSGSVRTVLTSEKGRVIDWIQVRPGINRLLLVCHAASRERVQSWVERFIISEDVEFLPVNHSPEVRSLILPQPDPSTCEVPDRMGIDEFAVPEFGIWEYTLGPFAGRRFAVSAERLGDLTQRIGAHGPPTLTTAEYTALRVLAGVPSAPHELNDTYNPLESSLRSDVSFSKGCYVGQEVIARLDSYDKVQRELVVLRVEGPWIGQDAPCDILSNGEHAGIVTSIGGTLTDGSLLLMGYIDRSIRERLGGLGVGRASMRLSARTLETSDLKGWPWEMPA